MITGDRIRIAKLSEMVQEADLKKRRGKNSWWWELRKVVDIMSGKLQNEF